MDMASNQPDNLALTAEQLREYSAAFNADRANLVAANAAVSNGILQAATSYRGVRELPARSRSNSSRGRSPRRSIPAAAGCSHR